MKISSNSWKSYIKNLSKIDKKAAETVSNYYREHPDLSVEQLISYCLAVSDYYGSAAGELACEMYEEVAAASGRLVPTPEPAPTATYGEMAKTVQGVLAQSQNPDAVGAAVGRKVKTVGLDTILKNSLRDGAQFAWIPSGDTCAFCMMLASNGWQRASKKALKNGHASHVHNNCDCSYAVRFDDNTEVEGYDPDYYKDMYDNAEGDNWNEKLNSMRRVNYAKNKDKINEQKRIAYAKRARQDEILLFNANGSKLSKEQEKKSWHLSASTSSSNTYTKREELGFVKVENTEKAINHYREVIRNKHEEHAIVIEKDGKVLHFTGTKESVGIFDCNLDGAHILHNHPVSEGDISFGPDDFMLIKEHQTAIYDLCSESYDYHLEVIKDISELSYNEIRMWVDISVDELQDKREDIQHLVMEALKKEGYTIYERKRKN